METVYWVREIVEKGAQWFAVAGPQWTQRPALVLGFGPRARSRACTSRPPASPLRELIDEYCGGMLDGHEFYGYLPGGASGGILPASKGDIPLDFDTLQPHGCFIGSAAVVVLSQPGQGRGRGAEPDEVLPRRVLRQMHALPRRHREGA